MKDSPRRTREDPRRAHRGARRCVGRPHPSPRAERGQYRGERFRDHARDVKGDPDLLNLTAPEIVSEPPRRVLRGRGRHRHDEHVHRDEHRPVRLRPRRRRGGDEPRGRAACARFGRRVEGAHPGQAALRRGIGRSAQRHALAVAEGRRPRLPLRELRAGAGHYEEQIAALRDGGVDFLLIETIFDTLNAKAAIVAARVVAPELPLWLSFTAIDRTGRNLSGQTSDAFWVSVEHSEPFIVGVNCSLGATEMRPFLEGLANVASTYVSCHPNAGLPNALGLHDEEAGDTSRFLRAFAEDGLVNLVGGCCGTTPEHTSAIARAVEGLPPRRVPAPPRGRASRPRPVHHPPDSGFVVVGERTNVTGSARFRRLIEANDFQGAVEVALEQVRGGANLLDVNMDADLLDARGGDDDVPEPVATEPEIARLPIMVDSSRFSALEAGLRCLQGKGVVNSISLKEGEEPFLEQAATIRRFGAAAVVMAFDESGQAETVERKVEILGRAYDLLTGRPGSPPRRSSSIRTSSRSGPGSRSTQASRRPSSRRSRG